MIRKRQQKSLSIDKSSETRNLEWIPLAPPDFIINPVYLIDGFVEREIYYYGTMTNISSKIEMTKRNEILRLIDNGYKIQQLIAPEGSNIISICAQNITINERLKPESNVLRIPMEEIKSVAYVKDNSLHYIAILNGTQTERNSIHTLNLAVISAEDRIKAEEICSLINQCFQIIYTEATIRRFDRQVPRLNTNIELVFKEKEYENKKTNQRVKSTNSVELGGEHKSLYDIESVYSDLSSSRADFLQNFMMQLRNVLNKEEMKRFAECLSAWQQGGPFETFCSQMQQLLGPNRIGVLANMKNFIDPADWFTLEQFLSGFSPQSKSNSPSGNWSNLFGKGPLPAFHMQRSLSYASTSNGVLSIYDEENSIRDEFSSPIKSIYTSKRLSESRDNTEFSKAIDTLFHKVGDLELILSSDK